MAARDVAEVVQKGKAVSIGAKDCRVNNGLPSSSKNRFSALEVFGCDENDQTTSKEPELVQVISNPSPPRAGNEASLIHWSFAALRVLIHYT